MADKDLWQAFTQTGSIADYLNYKGTLAEVEKEETGERKVESSRTGNRNDTVRNAHGGL